MKVPEVSVAKVVAVDIVEAVVVVRVGVVVEPNHLRIIMIMMTNLTNLMMMIMRMMMRMKIWSNHCKCQKIRLELLMTSNISGSSSKSGMRLNSHNLVTAPLLS